MSDLQQDIKELEKQINVLTLTVAKLNSHLESEQGNNERRFDNLDKKITKVDHRVFGNGSEGLTLEIDRLKQTAQQTKSWNKYLFTAICALAVKIGYDIIKIIH